MAIQQQRQSTTRDELATADWHPLTVNRDRAPKASFFKRWNGTTYEPAVLVGYNNIALTEDIDTVIIPRLDEWASNRANYARLWMRPSDGMYAYVYDDGLGLVDVDAFNPEFFGRLDTILTLAGEREIAIEVLLWDRTTGWRQGPDGHMPPPAGWTQWANGANVHHPLNHYRSSVRMEPPAKDPPRLDDSPGQPVDREEEPLEPLEPGSGVPLSRTRPIPLPEESHEKIDFPEWYVPTKQEDPTGLWRRYQKAYMDRVMQVLRRHDNVAIGVINEAPGFEPAIAWRLHMHDYLRQQHPGIVIQSDGLGDSDDAVRARGGAGIVDMTATHGRWTYKRAHDEYHRYPGILPACNEAGRNGLNTFDPEDVRSTMWGLTMGGGVAYIEQDAGIYDHFKPIPHELHAFFHPPSEPPAFWNMEPRIDLVADNADGARYVLATSGAGEILVFVPRAAGRGTFQVRGSGNYRSRWFTADGARSSRGPWSTGSSWAFTPPRANCGLQIQRDGMTPSTVWEQDDFDALDLGSLVGQSGWRPAGSAGDPSAEVVARAEGGKMLRIDPVAGSGPAGTIAMNKDVPDQASGRHVLSFDVRVDGAAPGSGSHAKLELKRPSDPVFDKKCQLYFGSELRVNNRVDADVRPIPVMESGRWYHVDCELDLDRDLLDVWVDGTREVTAFSLRPGPLVGLALGGWDNTGVVYLDNVVGRAGTRA